ncbi:MAG: sulfate ABC transporter permease subunit CysW [Deltaproteobacteria bacterium]|nr:sulfate ABC transporter permease subunit CysW [Deltaproteobacteria bacterium]
MASAVPGLVPVSTEARRRANKAVITEPLGVRAILITFTVVGLGGLVALPLALVFVEAFRKGWAGYAAALANPETWAAIRLSLFAALIVVPANTIFGVSAAWLLTKHRFWGRRLLSTVIDLPFSVSPVISGLIFVLLFGAQGLLGPWLQSHDIKIIFALPGIVLATAFVTFPFVAREVLPALEAAGNDEEEAALTLGASGFTVFFRVTLPKIKWAVLYGVVLCTARALGEFGAVSVVSGHIRGETNTMPLQVEILYNEYDFTSAFAVASLLTLVAVITLSTKKLFEWYQEGLRHDSNADR